MLKDDGYNNRKLKICKNCGYKIAPYNSSNNCTDINKNYKSICIYEKSPVSYYNQIIDNSEFYKIKPSVNNLNKSDFENTSLNIKNTELDKNNNKDNKKSNEKKNTNYSNNKSSHKRKTKSSKKLKSSTKKHKSKNKKM